MTTILDGKAVGQAILAQIQEHSQNLHKKCGKSPGLAVIIIGQNPASKIYVGAKNKKAKECGFHSRSFALGEDITQAELLAKINQLNQDPEIHGILVQLPLPAHIDPNQVIQAIAPHKDVDGFHFINIGKLSAGKTDDAFIPCTPAGAMLLIQNTLGKDLSGLSAVVVGRSNIVGKPMAHLLLAANATVTIAHSKTRNLAQICRHGDILVAAVGQAEMIRAEWIKPGACVIDVGINRISDEAGNAAKSRLVGDVDFSACQSVSGAITPVPGGVGPMTIAMLMANTMIAAYRENGLLVPSLSL